MNIRNMTAKDKESFLAMSRDFYHSEAALHDFCQRDQERNLEAFLNGSPFVRCLILESEDSLIGYALISHSWTTEYGGPMIILEELYFRPEHRRKGKAGQFFQWLFREYDETAAGYRLEVAPGNAQVMDIYRKYGFIPLEYIQMIKTVKQ